MTQDEIEALERDIADIIRLDAKVDIHFDVHNADDLARWIMSSVLTAMGISWSE